MSWRLLICSFICLLLSLVALADTLIVAGHTQQTVTPFLVEKDEVLAPLASSLRLLGARISINGEKITLTTPDQTTLTYTVGSTAATDNGRKVTLPVAPRLIDETLLLPAKTLARQLGAEALYDTESRTLSIHPIITVTYETRPEGLTILVRSAVPLQFSSGRMTEPPRAFFDFKHVALGLAEQQIPLGAGRVERLRLSQYCATPSVVRMVIDFREDSSAIPVVSEQGRLVAITISEKVAETKLPEIAPVCGPVKLLAAALRTASTKQSELLVTTDGPAQVEAEYNKEKRQLVLSFENGLNALPAEQVTQLKDNLVEKILLNGTPDTPGATLTITFKQDVGYLIQQEATGVRVLMGAFDIRDMVIVLDAGHGGSDTGAPGQNGTFEKDVNLDVVLRTAKLLKSAGATVILTRSDDTFIAVKARPPIANARKADLFISVHCNSTVNRDSGSGTETYYNTPQSAKLAAAIHDDLIKGLGLKNRGVCTANYWVIKYSTMPSVLLELAFINNKVEEALLSSPEFRQQAAEAIVNGIRHYAATKDWQLRKTYIPPSFNAPTLATGGVEE